MIVTYNRIEIIIQVILNQALQATKIKIISIILAFKIPILI